MWPNLQFPADLVTFTEEILNGNLIFYAVIFEIITFEFSNVQSLMQKWKYFNLGRKYLDIFELEFQKGIVIFEIFTLDFFQKKTFVQKWNSLNLGPKVLYLGVLAWNFEKLFSYLKPVTSNLSYCKVWGKN